MSGHVLVWSQKGVIFAAFSVDDSEVPYFELLSLQDILFFFGFLF